MTTHAGLDSSLTTLLADIASLFCLVRSFRRPAVDYQAVRRVPRMAIAALRDGVEGNPE